MANNKYYSKEEITKRLRLKLKPRQTDLLDKLRQAKRGNNGAKEKLPPLR